MFPALLSRKWRDEPQSHIFRDTYSNSIILLMVKEKTVSRLYFFGMYANGQASGL